MDFANSPTAIVEAMSDAQLLQGFGCDDIGLGNLNWLFQQALRAASQYVGIVNVERFGAGVLRTPEQNQVAIEAAIASIPPKHRYFQDGGEASPYATRGAHVLYFPNPVGEYRHNRLISVPGDKGIVFSGPVRTGAVLRYVGTGDVGIRFAPARAQAGGYGFADLTYMAADIAILGSATGMLMMERFYHLHARNKGFWLVDGEDYTDDEFPFGYPPPHNPNVVWWVARDCIFEGSAYSNITVEASTKLVGKFDRCRSRLAGMFTAVLDCEGVFIDGMQFFGINKDNTNLGAYIHFPGNRNNNTNIYVTRNLFSSEETGVNDIGAEFGGPTIWQAPRQKIAFGPIAVDPMTALAPAKGFSNIHIYENDFAGNELGSIPMDCFIWENANIQQIYFDRNVINGGSAGVAGTENAFIVREVAKQNGRPSGTVGRKRFGRDNIIQTSSWAGKMFSHGGTEWTNLMQEPELRIGMPVALAATSGDFGVFPMIALTQPPTFDTAANERAFQLRFIPANNTPQSILCSLKLVRPCKSAPLVSLTAGNRAMREVPFNVETESVNGFRIAVGPLEGGTSYRLNVHVIDRTDGYV